MDFIRGKKAKISFELINNQIFIPVTLNGVKLTFLLDTGAGQTLLFSHQDRDIKLKNVGDIQFFGVGDRDSVMGIKSEGNILKIGTKLQIDSLTCYVIFNDNFNLSPYVGIPVHGIIGYDFFKDHPIKINYTGERITVYRRHQRFHQKTKRFERLYFLMLNQKPYTWGKIRFRERQRTLGLLLDSGYSGTLLFFPDSSYHFQGKQTSIKDYLGHGLGGDVYGIRSRIREFQLANYHFVHPIFDLPSSNSFNYISKSDVVKGLVGAEILRRFTCYFDYPHHVLYLKKNRNYTDPFHTNMSGLEFKHIGMTWEPHKIPVADKKHQHFNQILVTANTRYELELIPMYEILGVRHHSPSYAAGIRKGDRLLSINGRRAGNYSLAELYEIVKGKKGKHLRISVRRNGKKLKFKFELKDPIPFQKEK